MYNYFDEWENKAIHRKLRVTSGAENASEACGKFTGGE